MTYRLYPHEVGTGMIELDTDRHEVELFVRDHREQIQRFADSSTGLIAVWAVEFGAVNCYGDELPTGALYEHPECGLIWLEIG